MATVLAQPQAFELQAEKPHSLWHNRDYMLLWSGQLVSSLGSGITQLAFPLLVLAVTHSAAQAGIAGALALLPYLFLSLPAGALVDRWDRKRVMIVCDTGRALTLVGIPVAGALGHLSAAQLYGTALLEGTFFVFFSLSEIACLPRVVPREQLPRASAQNEGGTVTAGLLAPPLAGFLFGTLGQTIPFLTDSISYAVSVVSLRFIRTEFQDERTAARRNLRVEISEGVTWLRHNPLIRYMAFLTGGMNAAVSALYLTLILLARDRHAPTVAIGFMFAVVSAGGVLGAALAPRIQRRFGFGRVVITVFWIAACVWPLFAIAPNILVLGLLAAVVYALGPIYNAVQFAYRLALIPDELQGRVNSSFRLIAYGCAPLGVAVSGLLNGTLGPERTVLIFSALVVVLAVTTTLNPHVRRATRLDSLA